MIERLPYLYFLPPQKYQNGTTAGQQLRLSGTKMDIARRLDCELAVLNLED